MTLPLLIDVEALTSFETAEDGSTICLCMQDSGGNDVGVILPIECINSLMMTLPRMLAQAARRLHNDPKLRIVYPASRCDIELGDDFASRILTLGTPDGFSVSFKLSADQCESVGGSADALAFRSNLN